MGRGISVQGDEYLGKSLFSDFCKHFETLHSLLLLHNYPLVGFSLFYQSTIKLLL